jgi:hypothetical protein
MKPRFKIGDKVRIISNNENYSEFFDGVLTVSSIATNSDEHPGYDDGMDGIALYDFEAFPFSLYEYEIELVVKTRTRK